MKFCFTNYFFKNFWWFRRFLLNNRLIYFSILKTWFRCFQLLISLLAKISLHQELLRQQGCCRIQIRELFNHLFCDSKFDLFIHKDNDLLNDHLKPRANLLVTVVFHILKQVIYLQILQLLVILRGCLLLWGIFFQNDLAVH